MIKQITLLLAALFFSGHASTAMWGTACSDQAGMADSYVLALSSQSGFCQTYGYEAGKPECLKLSKISYQASHLTLHGLWPNQDSCGHNYGYCNVPAQRNHCDYPALALSKPVSDQLKQFMPSYFYGSCLERHEWNKHGSCQVLSADDYFTLAMRLTTEVDETAFGHYLTEHKGEKVKLTTLRSLISTSFGSKNAKKISLGCKDRILVDIFITLPALIPFTTPVEDLVNNAPNNKQHDSCPATIYISNFNKDSWY